MENKAQTQEIQIQGLLDNFLRFRTSGGSQATIQERHLDEDSLAAFVGGNLARREAAATVSHLADCSFCRHITAELIKLDYQFAEATEIDPSIVKTAEPSKISEVLSGILSRIFGSNEGAVFAHEEKKEDSENSEAETDEDKQ